MSEASPPISPSHNRDLQLYAYATGQIKKILTTEREVNFMSRFRPTAGRFCTRRVDDAGSDLVLMENFR